MIDRALVRAFKGKQEEDVFLRLFALNEVDARLTSGIDWRQKLDSQRGAVLATELKNNSCKLAKWTLQAMLASADLIKLGYVSRNHARDNNNHVLLGTQTCKPAEFARQINLNANNAWGILKSIVDVCLQLDEGRYLLLKDPNKAVLRLYSVPAGTFDSDEDSDDSESDEDDDTMINVTIKDDDMPASLLRTRSTIWRRMAQQLLTLRFIWAARSLGLNCWLPSTACWVLSPLLTREQ